MEAKRMPAEAEASNEQKTFIINNIPQRRPFGQAVPFAGYEKAAGSAKELVRLGREVCPKFDSPNYARAKKPDESGLTLYKPIVMAWRAKHPDVEPKAARSHEPKDRPKKITIRVTNELYDRLQTARGHKTMQGLFDEILWEYYLAAGMKSREQLQAEIYMLQAEIIKIKEERQ